VPPANAKSLVLANNRAAKVWLEGSRVLYSSDGPDLSFGELKRATSNTARYLSGMAEGKIAWRDRYFRYANKGGEHAFTLSRVDRATGKGIPGAARVIRGTYSQLPKDWRHAYDSMVRQQINLSRPGIAKAEVEAMVQSARDDPEYLRTLQPRASVPWKAAVLEGVKTGAATAAIATATDIVMQLIISRTVDWRQTGRIAVTGAFAGAVGSATSTMTAYLLTSNMATGNLANATGIQPWFSRASGLIGGAAGMFGAVAAFSYFPYVMGWTDIHAANSNFVAGTVFGVGSFLAAGGALTIATKFGVAGTGIAISTLSGVAAANAGLAFLGGGSLAAGGGGMAGGAAVLATTNVVGAVIIAGVVAYQGWTYIKGNTNQKLLIDKEFELRINDVYPHSL
ncbi:MAG: hypothetical protein LBT97_00605, partial [Planctomycetota bacterium]|nr:hypothetical protein [Planctomycetota bacterium]